MSRPTFLTIDDGLTGLIKLQLDELESFEPLTVAEKIALELVRAAVFDGDVATQKLLLERTSGRVGVAAKVETSSELVSAIREVFQQ